MNWFDTLYQALEAENLVDIWPLGLNIGYLEHVRITVDDGSRYGRLIAVYRDETGRYERPVHYRR